MFICKQKIDFILPVFLEILQRYCKLVVLVTMGMFDHPPSKMIALIYRKISCLSACKKSISSLIFFSKYCKEMADLLFWVIWACLATHILNDSINLRKSSMFICKLKINFILPVFLEILEGYCKLAIFGYFGQACLTQPKWYYHLVENFCIYLQAEEPLYPPFFSGDFAKVCKLSWVLWACLNMHTQDRNIAL